MQRTLLTPLTGFMVAASVSMSPYEPWLVDSVSLVLPMFLIPSDFLPVIHGVLQVLPNVRLCVSASVPISCWMIIGLGTCLCVCNHARLPVDGQGHRLSHKTYDLPFVLPATSAG